MKRQRHGKQVLAVLLAFCLFLPAVFSTPAAVPAADTGLNSQMTPEEQQSYLEMKLRQTEKTLETLGKQSKDTQAYLDALDQKIGYLRSQLKLTEQKVDTAENRITVLQKQQKKNRQDQAATFFSYSGTIIAQPFQQSDSIFFQSAFCQCNSKRLCHLFYLRNFFIYNNDFSDFIFPCIFPHQFQTVKECKFNNLSAAA